MIFIHGCGHYHPENIIDNAFLESLDIGTNNDWILERTGIQKRRTLLDLEYILRTKNSDPRAAREASLFSNAQTGSFAAESAISNSKINRTDIGMVISGSCTPQSTCPAEAATIAAQLDLEVPSFDLNSACSTLGAQINFLNMMDPRKLPDYILLVMPENNTKAVDYSDRSSAVLWGDATFAMVVSTKIPSRYLIKESTITSSPKGNEFVRFVQGGHFVQEGKTVQTFAIKKSIGLIKELRSTLSVPQSLNVKFIGHQANLLMLNSVSRIAEIKDELHYYNVDQYGNCGAAGAGTVLSQKIDQLHSGDHLIVAVVGAGLSWSGFLIEVS